ncbi:MAG: 16S rRNA (cytosine(967)-C(5))-methyltransferase RsmB [bacterium]
MAAFEILSRVDSGSFASVLLASKHEETDSRDHALTYELVMGVLRWQLWLDHLIEHFTKRSAARLDLPVLIALRLGLYQIRFLTRIPASAAVNESVNLVKRARVRSAEGLVNAVLRRAVREPVYDPASAIPDRLEKLSVSTSHPAWLIERWVNAFGEAETEAFATANNLPAPLAFRIVNRANESEILERLRFSGATVSSSIIVAGAWRLAGGSALLREFAQTGQVYIQDEGSQLVGKAMEVAMGDRVLDVCAAPGSKATQMARTFEGVRLVAGDLYEHRIHTLTEAARLQGIETIDGLVLDAGRSLPFVEAAFERVLVDVPCSGTGTLRHNPEIRWRISAEDIQELGRRQLQILLNSARMVKPGGRLIYSTCSVESEENEAIVHAFLQSSDRFKRAPLKVHEALLTGSGAARTWPHREGADGFFIAAFTCND